MQSTLSCNGSLHVAIIMDGNGRWATARGLARAAGHRAGVESIRRVCEAAPALGIATLTLFAFSADNWRRPQAEVDAADGTCCALICAPRSRVWSRAAHASP